ncbi:uncharacterized protein RAG0_16696 [Rhynchosporium agropyri]|uniref:RanBP2-type domain-containing protein n=1 Tax=Rhynchosporium agropyri TaxID=914238 RepID=A0A1E1LRM3_9HELO|nr:uncharacterized protein RAG0_16696 [Rhynchosporium agropyri]
MMSEKGLQHSRWAHSDRGRESLKQQPGDWTCASCHFSNFQWRTGCFRCSAHLGNAPDASTYKHTIVRNVQTADYHNGYLQQAEVPMRAVKDSLPDVSGKGLAVSRWAPRYANMNQSAQINSTLWTRTKQQHTQTSSPTPKSSDLGLPYQVQHYILVMIQRMLEESCFEFAGRWLPDFLHAKGWDCAEAVELSTWKAILPSVLPANALRPMSNYTLEGALSDAVRIRNSATHRHLCDNEEIRRMSLQAQDLMSMLGDGTRADKFHRLWLELKEWDLASKSDAQGARSRLEAALKGISERPVDDMDWTPNATMSLQEVLAEGATAQGPSQPGYVDVDEMDLD